MYFLRSQIVQIFLNQFVRAQIEQPTARRPRHAEPLPLSTMLAQYQTYFGSTSCV